MSTLHEAVQQQPATLPSGNHPELGPRPYEASDICSVMLPAGGLDDPAEANSRQRMHICSLKAELNKANDQLANAESAHKSVSDQLREVSAQLAIAESAHDSVNDQLRDANDQLRDANDQLAIAESAHNSVNDQLRDANDQLRDANDQLAIAESAHNSVNDQLRDANDQLRDANDQLANAESAHRSVHDQLRVANEKRANAEGHTHFFRQQCSDLQDHFTCSKRQLEVVTSGELRQLVVMSLACQQASLMHSWPAQVNTQHALLCLSTNSSLRSLYLLWDTYLVASALKILSDQI